MTMVAKDTWDFLFQYENLQFADGRNMTYLCYCVEEKNGDTPMLLHIDVLQNEVAGSHVEILFLSFMRRFLASIDQSLQEARESQVTWYISWSPCADCANTVATFLRERNNVHLRLFASRLYYRDVPEYQQGLRALKEAGAQVEIMSSLEFSDCWDHFVDHQGECFEPWEEMDENVEIFSQKLQDILETR
ncbi:single-stranded DNA cytosine deaminase-like [Echinops telfairi]|uniref:Single-stranded DNA cytosine deaminase-like n=1 Tax=Echinops telfairi TaxID=9371 RepID=A0AC55D554_ECHTE|nr:single-stranded DNA cytosine deaminase-like [Echinops telfairi]